MLEIHDITVDELRSLNLTLVQPARGYRYSIDAFLLAFFASGFKADALTEFGCGCGVISLLVSRRNPRITYFELFEIQPSLFRLACLNVERNALQGQEMRVRCEDVRFALPEKSPGLVVCNPPFVNPNAGRVSPDRQRALARSWFTLAPSELFASFERMTGPDAGLCLIFPARDCNLWLREGGEVGLWPTDLLSVRSRDAGRDVLMLARFHREKVAPVHSTISLYDSNGTYSEIGKEILGLV